MVRELRNDAAWSLIHEKMCSVSRFLPVASMEGDKIINAEKMEPYAYLEMDCLDNLDPDQQDKFRGAVTHRLDFQALWWAFRVRGIAEDETLTICWSKRRLKPYARFFSRLMPHLGWAIFAHEALKLLTERDYRPDLFGEERFLRSLPLLQQSPQVWDGSLIPTRLDQLFEDEISREDSHSYMDEVYSIIAGPNVAERSKDEIWDTATLFLHRWTANA